MKIEIQRIDESWRNNYKSLSDYNFVIKYPDRNDEKDLCKDIADVIDTISVRLNQEFKQ